MTGLKKSAQMILACGCLARSFAMDACKSALWWRPSSFYALRQPVRESYSAGPASGNMASTGGEHPDGITPGTTKVVAPCSINLCQKLAVDSIISHAANRNQQDHM